MHIFKTMDTCLFFSENAWKRCSHTLSSQILFISVFYMNFTWIYNTNVIHSGYLYSTSSSPLLLRGAPDTAYTVSEFHAKAPQATASEGLAQGPYVAARAGFELTTLRMKGDKSTNEPSCPTIMCS